MIKRIIYISSPCYISSENEQLVVDFKEKQENTPAIYCSSNIGQFRYCLLYEREKKSRVSSSYLTYKSFFNETW